MATIYGTEIEARVGSIVRPDGWRFAAPLQTSYCERGEGDDSFAGSDFVLRGSTGMKYPVNVTVTGSTWQRREGDYWVRVKFEFVQDGSEDTACGGWMKRAD